MIIILSVIHINFIFGIFSFQKFDACIWNARNAHVTRVPSWLESRDQRAECLAVRETTLRTVLIR